MSLSQKLYRQWTNLSFEIKSIPLSFISGGLGAALGAVIGTFALPGVGTAMGAFYGFALGLGFPLTCAGLYSLFNPQRYSSTILLTGNLTLGAVIGSIIGTFVFPGLGTMAGSLIGAGIGAATTISCEIISYCKTNLLANFGLSMSYTGVGAGIGALIGAFAFPGFGAPLGAAVGAGIGFGIYGVSALVVGTGSVIKQGMSKTKIEFTDSDSEIETTMQHINQVTNQIASATKATSEAFQHKDNFNLFHKTGYLGSNPQINEATECKLF